MREQALQTTKMNSLFQAISSLKTKDEAKLFLRDLCTISELEAMAERWQVVQLLNKNISYRAIAKKTGSSTATITRVAHWLHHGMEGYKFMLKRAH